MTTVSVSQTGKESAPPPTREERDEASSSDCGRKAVEKPLENVLPSKRSKKQEQPVEQEHPAAPIGLEMETVAEEFLEEKP